MKKGLVKHYGTDGGKFNYQKENTSGSLTEMLQTTWERGSTGPSENLVPFKQLW